MPTDNAKRNAQTASPRPAAPLVVSIAFRGLSVFEAGIAAEVFGAERPELPAPLYRFAVAQVEPGLLRTSGGLRLRADAGLELLSQAHWIVVPGWRDVHERPPQRLLDALIAAHARGSRLLSICSGAFVLAAAGLLDGRPATTHWRYVDAFRALYPQVRLDPDVLYVDDGDIVTSAGSAAGIDACLHVVRRDYGTDIANLVARAMVSSPHRSGGQAQYIPAPVPIRSQAGLAQVLDWARKRLDQPLSIPQLAEQAAMSERTFLRRFIEEVGMTPKAWLIQQRVFAAQRMLEASTSPMDDIALACGFGSPEAFRLAFRKTSGVAPSVYRERFRIGPT
ncbi:MAG: transcriptional regulator [Pseudomonadales bacterium RIFCSPLOWO2_02_FULL_63_210]|nr:MAG: transcriptional regulator [Pseudomonadales bacterium RIFCSPLOWO2_02_FULL_63_210]